MDLLSLITSFTAAGALALTALAQIELWQRKEYRWDRMEAWLLSPEAKLALLPLPALAALLTDAGWLIVGRLPQLADGLGFAALLIFALHLGSRTWRRGIRRPQLTLKAILVLIGTGLAFGLYLGLTFVPAVVIALQLATLFLLTPLIIAAVVGGVNLVAAVRKKQIIARAAAHRAALPHLTVVGITGSYGKTSTKHFLQQLLAGLSYRVAVTSEHRNAPLPVAQDMLKHLKRRTTHYIAEHGAYRSGEIAAVAALTRPRVAVITAIGNQHLALFGSQEVIARTKWELIEALPPDGIAVLNADDEHIVRLSKSVPQRIVWFSTKKQCDVYLTRLVIKPEYMTAELHIDTKKTIVTIPLSSEALLGSVLAAVACGHALGVATVHLVRQVEHLTPFPRTMEIAPGIKGSLIIDDSYSANEKGVLIAIEHLKRFPQPDKRIVLVPLIELGSEAAAIHQRIGHLLAKSGARVFIYGQAYRHELTPPQGQCLTNPRQLTQLITADVDAQTVILLEGRLPEVVRQAVRI